MRRRLPGPLRLGVLGVGTVTLWCLAAPAPAGAQSIVLYTNDFESPNVPIQVSCGNSLDSRTIDALYGAPGFAFHQVKKLLWRKAGPATACPGAASALPAD